MRASTFLRKVSGVLAALVGVGCQSQFNHFEDATDPNYIGVATAAEVNSRHFVSVGGSAYVLVPCGQSRFVGHFSSPSQFRGLWLYARAEWGNATLRVTLRGPSTPTPTEQTLTVGAARAGQRFEVPRAVTSDNRDVTWVIELHAEGVCEGVRVYLGPRSQALMGT